MHGPRIKYLRIHDHMWSINRYAVVNPQDA